MNKWLPSISITIVLMIVLSSIIQFHHHDDNGSIILAITTIDCDDEHNNGHDNHCDKFNTHTHCKCNHDNEQSPCSSNKCISHLGDYQIVKQPDFIQSSYPTILLAAILHGITNLSSVTISNTTKLFIQHSAHQSDGVPNIASLRAPPMS